MLVQPGMTLFKCSILFPYLLRVHFRFVLFGI